MIRYMFIILVIIQNVGFGQSTFFNRYPSVLSERVFQAVETSQGDFLIVGEIDTSTLLSSVKGYILKISSCGEIIDELTYADEYYNLFRFRNIFELPTEPNIYMVIGAIDSLQDANNWFNKVLLLTINNNMEVITNKTFSSIPNYVYHPWKYTLAGDSILYLQCELFHINVSQEVGIIKFSLPGDSVTSTSTPEPYNHIVADILYLNDQDRINVFYYGALFESTMLKILILDPDLSYIDCIDGPDHISTTASVARLTDSTYIISATGTPITYPKQHIVSYLMKNSNDSIKKLEYAHHPDTILYAGGGTNTVLNQNSIFITGIYNIDPQFFPWQTSPTWIQITRTDLDLNITSQHFYGGDAEYFPYCITATSDGGALITGFMWDYSIPGNEQWDVFALKVDTSGLVTDIPEDVPWQKNDAILYPNPSTDYFIAIVSVQYSDAKLFLFDLQGKLILEQDLHQPQTRVSSESIPAGNFVYRFISSGKVIGEGKWVKL